MTTGTGPRLRTFLVEAYSTARTLDDLVAASGRAEAVVAALREAGTPIAYRGATLIPEDEVVFHVFDARDPGSVRTACRRSSIAGERIVESIVVEVDAPRSGLVVVPTLPVRPSARRATPDRARASRR